MAEKYEERYIELDCAESDLEMPSDNIAINSRIPKSSCPEHTALAKLKFTYFNAFPSFSAHLWAIFGTGFSLALFWDAFIINNINARKLMQKKNAMLEKVLKADV